MNSLKTLFVMGILVAVAYGVYVAINTAPSGSLSLENATDWSTGPSQEPAPLKANPFAPGDMAAVPAAVDAMPAPPPGMPKFDPGEGFVGITDQSSGALQPAPYAYREPEGSAFPPGHSVAGDQAPTASMPADPMPPAAPATAPTEPPAAVAESGDPVDDNPRPEFTNFITSVQQSLAKGELLDAYRGLCRFYGHPGLKPVESRQLTELLDQVAGTVVYDPAQHLLEAAYVVRQGETLQQIADRYQVPWQMLARINGIRDPLALAPGQSLKVIRGPVEAELRVGDCELTLMLPGRCYAGRFPVGVGPDLPQTADMFLVSEKQGPSVYGDSGSAAADAAAAPFIALDAPGGAAGPTPIGIHAATQPGDVGRPTDRGSISVAQRDISDLYDILSVGSTVRVIR